jgi:hypothetical protein
MWRAFGKWLVVFLLILTVGGHWAFLQTVAWVGMAVDYSSADGLSTGLSKTFDGKHPCKLCKLVSESKKAEKKSEAKFDIKKLECSGFVASEFYFPPLEHIPSSSILLILSQGKAPPTPPPVIG